MAVEPIKNCHDNDNGSNLHNNGKPSFYRLFFYLIAYDCSFLYNNRCDIKSLIASIIKLFGFLLDHQDPHGINGGMV